MAEQITFRGTHIRYFDGRQEEGGAFVRIHMTADFSTPVMEAMDWTDPGPSVTDTKLEGELNCTHLILTPGDKNLRKNEIQFDIRSVEDFKMVVVKEKESTRRELRFVARSSAPGVAAQVDEYIRRIGEHQGALKVSYVKQETLPLTESKSGPSTGDERPGPSTGDDRQTTIDQALKQDRDTGCTSCNAGLPLVPGEKKHDNGMACTAVEAPAPTMADKKKARKDEEARKAALKTETKGDWPVPNEFGAYPASEELTLEFLGKKCSAYIQYLQIGPAQWIAARVADSSEEGYSAPLGADVVYPSKEIAIACEAHAGADDAYKRAESSSKPTIKKQWESIQDWFVEQHVKFANQADPDAGDWMEADYTVVPDSEEVAGASIQ